MFFTTPHPSSPFVPVLTPLSCSSQTLVMERGELIAAVLKWGTVLDQTELGATLWGYHGRTGPPEIDWQEECCPQGWRV